MEELVIEHFKRAKNRLILLDYDGTLVDYHRAPHEATPPEQLLLTLMRLNASPDTRLVIITGRAYADIDRFIGYRSIDLVAEHGAMVRENGQWKELVQDNGTWKQVIHPIMDRFVTACPGSFIEEKRFSLAWHYRNASGESGFAVSRELIEALQARLPALGLKITDGNKVIEIKKKDIDKGRGTKYLLNGHPYDFILSVGDDRTDEDMFAVLLNNPHAFTIKVGTGESLAKYRLDHVDHVMRLLNELL
jgi:trehalose 6-phosphate synthase/phosphatase